MKASSNRTSFFKILFLLNSENQRKSQGIIGLMDLLLSETNPLFDYRLFYTHVYNYAEWLHNVLHHIMYRL